MKAIERIKAGYNQILSRIEAIGRKILLPGFEGISLWEVLSIFVEGFTKGAVTTRASAISFKIILALAPSVILLFTLIPYIPVENFQDNLFAIIKNTLPPAVFDFVEGLLLSLINNKYGTFLSISFVLGLYYASNSAHAMLQGLKESYHLENKQSAFKQRIYSIVLLLILPLFLGSAFLIQTLSSFIINEISQIFVFEFVQTLLILLAKWVITLCLILLAISTLYNLAIENRKRWRIVSPGTLFATIFIVLASEGFSYYVTHFGQFNKFYGSLGTVVVLLLWIYFLNVILILGFEVNMTLKKAKKHASILD